MRKKDLELIEKMRKQADNMRKTGNADWASLIHKAANRMAQMEREMRKYGND